MNLSALCKIYDFVIVLPGFQCDQAYLSAPDNAKFQPRNPRFPITKSFSDSLLSRNLFYGATGETPIAPVEAYASLNFFCSTPWPITTARSRPTAFIVVTNRCDGAFSRNSSFE